MATVKWGVLGCADIARKVVLAIEGASNATLHAVASRDKAKADSWAADNCKNSDPKGYGSYQELLDDADVQAVYIPLPTGLRKEWILKAAANKKHVLTEKPVAPTAAEVREIVKACQDAGVQLMDNVMFMHSKRLPEMRKVLDDRDKFGRPIKVRSTFCIGCPIEGDFKENIRMKKETEPLGVLGDLGWYNIRFAMWAFNYESPTSVSCHVHHKTEDGVPLDASATMKFSDGRVAVFDCSFVSSYSQMAQVSSAKASLEILDLVVPCETPKTSYSIVTGSIAEKALSFPRVAEEASAPDCVQEQCLIENMSSIVTSGTLDPFWPRVALQTQLIMDALVESADKDGCLTGLEAEK